MDAAASTTMQNAFLTLAPPVGIVTSATAGMILLWVLTRGAIRGVPPHSDVIAVSLGAFISGVFLNNYDAYVDFTYAPIMEWTNFVSTSILTGSGTTAHNTAGLLAEASIVCFAAIDLAMLIIKDAGWNIGLILAGVILMIPPIASLVIYSGLIIFALFLFKIPVALGPLLLWAAVTKATRKLLFSGLDFFITASALTIIASFIVSVSSTAARLSAQSFPQGLSPWAQSQSIATADAARFVFSTQYWAVLLLLCLNMFFLILTPQLAGYFSGRVDSANLAGQIGGAAARLGGGALNTVANLRIAFRGSK